MIYHFFSAKHIHLSPLIINSILTFASKTNEKGLKDISIIVEDTSGHVFKGNNQTEIYKKIAERHDYKNLQIISNKWILLGKILKINKSDKIFFHSMLNFEIIILLNFILYLFRMKRKALSLNFICWGSDFGFCHKFNQVDTIIKRSVAGIFEKVWPWYGNIITLIKSDEIKVRDAYGSNNVITIPYINSRKIEKINKDSAPIKIMVSHSGWPHNNHRDSFEKLERFKNEDIEIICPLCYGNPEYIKQTICLGKATFGDKFKYFTDLMSNSEYVNFVHSVHIYVSAAEVQTGLGAVSHSIDGNAKIFLKEPLYSSLTNDGFKIFPFENLNDISFNEFVTPMEDDNLKIVYKNKQKILDETVRKWKEVYAK